MDENTIKVQTTYCKNNQGLVLTFKISVDYDQIDNLIKISNMFSGFVFENFTKILKKYQFCAKSKSPIIVGNKEDLELYLCFVAEENIDLQNNLKKIGIKQVEDYV